MHAFFCKCVLKTTGFNPKLFNLWVEVCTTLKMHYFQYFEFCNETFSRRPKTNTTEGKLEPEGMTIRMGMSSLVVENLLSDRRDGTPQPQHFFIIFPRWRKLPTIEGRGHGKMNQCLICLKALILVSAIPLAITISL